MIPVLLVGPPGVGKTATTFSNYDYVEVLLLSACTEEDIAGIPYQVKGREFRTQPPFIQRLKEAKGTRCLFLDELDKARRSVADTLLSLVQNPERFGLDSDIQIMAAANPPEWGGGDGISKAMQSRFSVVTFTPSVKDWQEYIERKFDNAGASKVAARVVSGEIPLLDVTGEDYAWRLTCPRTLDRALEVMTASLPWDKKVTYVQGLLTPNAASGVTSCFSSSDPVQALSRRVGAAAIRKRGQPLRV